MSKVNFSIPQDPKTVLDFYTKTRGGMRAYKGTDGKRQYLHIKKNVEENNPVWQLGWTKNKKRAAKVSDVDKVIKKLINDKKINNEHLMGVNKILNKRVRKEKKKFKGLFGFFRKLFCGKKSKIKTVKALKNAVENKINKNLKKLNSANSKIDYLENKNEETKNSPESHKNYVEIEKTVLSNKVSDIENKISKIDEELSSDLSESQKEYRKIEKDALDEQLARLKEQVENRSQDQDLENMQSA